MAHVFCPKAQFTPSASLHEADHIRKTQFDILRVHSISLAKRQDESKLKKSKPFRDAMLRNNKKTSYGKMKKMVAKMLNKEKLIEFVRSYPCLYGTTTKEYKDEMVGNMRGDGFKGI